MEGGKRVAGSGKQRKPDMSQFSKWIVADIRPLLWFVTVGGFALAFYCVTLISHCIRLNTATLPLRRGSVGERDRAF